MRGQAEALFGTENRAMAGDPARQRGYTRGDHAAQHVECRCLSCFPVTTGAGSKGAGLGPARQRINSAYHARPLQGEMMVDQFPL